MAGRGPQRLLVGPLLVATVALLAAACGEEVSAQREDGLAVAGYQATAGGGGDDALLTGRIDAVDGCLVVREGGDSGTWVPVFASSDERPLTVNEGEEVELGGGEAVGQDDTWDLPESCPSAGPFWVVAQP